MMMTGHDQIRAGLFKTHWANFLNLYQHFEVGREVFASSLKLSSKLFFLIEEGKNETFILTFK